MANASDEDAGDDDTASFGSEMEAIVVVGRRWRLVLMSAARRSQNNQRVAGKNGPNFR